MVFYRGEGISTEVLPIIEPNFKNFDSRDSKFEIIDNLGPSWNFGPHSSPHPIRVSERRDFW